MKRKILSILFALVLSFSLVTPVVSAHPDEWYVDASMEASGDGTSPGTAFKTVQEGIDAADPGDTVSVAAGTYYENISLRSGVTVQGAGAEVTFISGGAPGSVVTANNVDSNAKLDGFTITNGTGTFHSFVEGDAGGGMLNDYSSPIVTNCTFWDNSADDGGGMYNFESSPTVTNCTFWDNSADYGGGMSNQDDSSPTVTNCTFWDNSAGDGGGMFNENSSPTVTDCTFWDNSADYGGGGMHNENSSPTVTNCTFSGNSAGDSGGGGMFNHEYSSPTVTNCTFWDNSAGDSGGGGMFNQDDSSPIVTNCILWDNEGEEIYNESSTPVVSFSDIRGGYDGEGNISDPPLFKNAAAGDYHLLPDSPCIDAGSNAALSLPSTDFEGDPRICPSGGVVDMGADECCIAIVEGFPMKIKHMVIDFHQRPSDDKIAITKATFRLEEGATCNLSADNVSVSIDGVTITIPAGSFVKKGKKENYRFASTKGVEPKVTMKLDFNKGEWSLTVRKIDASAVDSCDGVDVALFIGDMSAAEHVNMRAERISYEAEP